MSAKVESYIQSPLIGCAYALVSYVIVCNLGLVQQLGPVYSKYLGTTPLLSIRLSEETDGYLTCQLFTTLFRSFLNQSTLPSCNWFPLIK